MRGQAQGVTLFRKARAALPGRDPRDSHVRWWAGMASPGPSSKQLDMGWGFVTMTVATAPHEPSDVRIDFHDDLKSRKAAFEFARLLYDEFQSKMPHRHIEFMSAHDHYHVLVSDPSYIQGRAVASLLGTLSEGALSGRRIAERSAQASFTRRFRERLASED